MTPQEIEKRIAAQHNPAVKQQSNSWYPYICECKCGYQAVAKSVEEGNYYARQHLDAQRRILNRGGMPDGNH